MTLIFRIVGFLEGISYILLMGVGMPLKYFSNDPSWIQALGMPHGLLFVAYIILAIFYFPKGTKYLLRGTRELNF